MPAARDICNTIRYGSYLRSPYYTDSGPSVSRRHCSGSGQEQHRSCSWVDVTCSYCTFFGTDNSGLYLLVEGGRDHKVTASHFVTRNRREPHVAFHVGEIGAPRLLSIFRSTSPCSQRRILPANTTSRMRLAHFADTYYNVDHCTSNSSRFLFVFLAAPNLSPCVSFWRDAGA